MANLYTIRKREWRVRKLLGKILNPPLPHQVWGDQVNMQVFNKGFRYGIHLHSTAQHHRVLQIADRVLALKVLLAGIENPPVKLTDHLAWAEGVLVGWDTRENVTLIAQYN